MMATLLITATARLVGPNTGGLARAGYPVAHGGYRG